MEVLDRIINGTFDKEGAIALGRAEFIDSRLKSIVDCHITMIDQEGVRKEYRMRLKDVYTSFQEVLNGLLRRESWYLVKPEYSKGKLFPEGVKYRGGVLEVDKISGNLYKVME